MLKSAFTLFRTSYLVCQSVTFLVEVSWCMILHKERHAHTHIYIYTHTAKCYTHIYIYSRSTHTNITLYVILACRHICEYHTRTQLIRWDTSQGSPTFTNQRQQSEAPPTPSFLWPLCGPAGEVGPSGASGRTTVALLLNCQTHGSLWPCWDLGSTTTLMCQFVFLGRPRQL